jgi:hypothetical protein
MGGKPIAPIERQLPSVGNESQYEEDGNPFAVLKLTPEQKQAATGRPG